MLEPSAGSSAERLSLVRKPEVAGLLEGSKDMDDDMRGVKGRELPTEDTSSSSDVLSSRSGS
eukprot:3918970-Rhodomonas_salina.1